MLSRIRRLRPAAFIAGFLAAVVLTGGGAAAYAANGGSLLIGRSNSATATTTLTNSSGIPLKLVAKPGYPPLTVNSTTHGSLPERRPPRRAEQRLVRPGRRPDRLRRVLRGRRRLRLVPTPTMSARRRAGPRRRA